MRRVIVDHVSEGSTPSFPSNYCGPVAQLEERLSCKEEDVVQLHPGPPNFGFVAQKVERHVEGVSVAVSKSAEATKLSARSLAWIEALALGASSREFKSLRADHTSHIPHLGCEPDQRNQSMFTSKRFKPSGFFLQERATLDGA